MYDIHEENLLLLHHPFPPAADCGNIDTVIRKRFLYGAAVPVLALLIILLVWQGSFSFGDFGPTTPQQTLVYWALSTLIFILTVTVGFMLLRTALKLYLERLSNREGSRLRTKLVVGALALSIVPVIFLVLFHYAVLNLNLRRWFTRPAENIRLSLISVSNQLQQEVRGRIQAQAQAAAAWPEARWVVTPEADSPEVPNGFWAAKCRENGWEYLAVRDSHASRALCGQEEPAVTPQQVLVRAPIRDTNWELVLGARMPFDLAAKQMELEGYVREHEEIRRNRDRLTSLYIEYMLLITLFVLFIATWIALFLARQISVPISALLTAASEVRRGNLSYRVQTPAFDEIATLVRSFNEMMQELEANGRELESRRRFTEAILESIPTGVISVSSEGRILRINRALQSIFTPDLAMNARELSDLFAAEDLAEIRYLMKRSRRTGAASSQLQFWGRQQLMHLAVTVAPADDRQSPSYVIVLEDTSELLRAQKAEAWHEVARRIAHELKNPLTPISLCAERIGRQIDRGLQHPDALRILQECSVTIAREVESVKNLADEFSQFARFPAAQLIPTSLNDVVRNGLAVFAGRLQQIHVQLDLAEDLPPVLGDPEHLKRIVVNLVDNAAEAMHDSLVREILITTRATDAENAELVVMDTGPGVSREDKEKLFLPYFSTKERGTGLGLAIVSHIVAEHHGTIRVEDNRPAGARFVVDLPLAAVTDSESKNVGVSA